MSTSNKITWREAITDEMEDHADEWGNIIEKTLTEDQADSDLYGGDACLPFTAWTNHRVYFPICYDGTFGCGSASRYPDGQPTKPQGGG